MGRLLKNKLMLGGFIIVGVMAIVGVLAPFLVTVDPNKISLEDALIGPSWQHLLGTDELGRDVYSRMVYGTRISLSVGLIAVGIATLIGILLGTIAAFYGGSVDSLICRFIDVMLCFPTIFLILAVVSFLEPNVINIMVIIGLTSWMAVARIIRAEVLRLKEIEFVQAAKAIGVDNITVIRRHLVPNALAPILVNATLSVGGAILIESSLSFLGLGVQPPTPSWGNILMEGKAALAVAWWLTVFPGMAILITVLGYNLLGEGLNDAYNPRRRLSV